MKSENFTKFYFDYNATTPVHPEVVKIMNQYYLQDYGNAGSVHEFGLQSHNGLDYARAQCADFIHAKTPEIIFTSGGTEADNLALQGVLYKVREKLPNSKPHLIIDTIEHPAVWNTAKFLETQGFEVSYVPVDKYGRVNPQSIKEAIQPNTALISIMYANNEIGTINPIREIGQIAHEHNILFHTDAVQAFAKTNINVNEENIDLLSVSAHKFYGPKGVGFLFCKNDSNANRNESTAFKHLRPLMYGGSQEFNLRPATENVPGLVGMGKAIEIASADLQKEIKKLSGFRDYLIKHILSDIPNTELNGHPTHRLCNNANILFHGVFAYDLMIELDNVGYGVSVGAACHAGDTKPSRVLQGIGRTDEEAASSMRISVGRWTTQAEIETLLALIESAVKKLRKS